MPVAAMLRRHCTVTCASHCTGAAVAVAIFGLFAVWAWDAAIPVVSVSVERIEPATVRSGGTIIVRLDVSRYRSCPATVYQWIFDGRDVQFALAPFTVDARPLGHDRLALSVPVPESAQPGQARYQLAYTHVCKPLNLWTSEHRASLPYAAFTIE